MAGKGVTIEECQARINDAFPDNLQNLKGQKYSFFCSSDDGAFRLGGDEVGALNKQGIRPGMLRDSRAVVQHAREDGQSRQQGA